MDHSTFLTSRIRGDFYIILLFREVIVVTPNYRLGALGFLCLGSDVVTHICPIFLVLLFCSGPWQCWLERPGSSSSLGEGEHWPVWRGRRQGDHLWGVRWKQQCFTPGDPPDQKLVGEPDPFTFHLSATAPQLLSPYAEGTFQRAILQSGTALGISWGAPNTPQKAKIESLQKNL